MKQTSMMFEICTGLVLFIMAGVFSYLSLDLGFSFLVGRKLSALHGLKVEVPTLMVLLVCMVSLLNGSAKLMRIKLIEDQAPEKRTMYWALLLFGVGVFIAVFDIVFAYKLGLKRSLVFHFSHRHWMSSLLCLSGFGLLFPLAMLFEKVGLPVRVAGARKTMVDACC